MGPHESCAFSNDQLKNEIGHISQEKVLSPLWDPMCLFKSQV